MKIISLHKVLFNKIFNDIRNDQINNNWWTTNCQRQGMNEDISHT